MITPATSSPPRIPGIALLAAVTVLGSIATHAVVPALPNIAASLNTSNSAIQAVVTIYLFVLGAGQLIVGPLSDRLGRRPVLLVGIAVFVLGSALAALAPDAPTLYAARALQAMGGCCGVVLSRAIVQDSADSRDALARLAALTAMVMLAPAAAPALGAWIDATLGWRALFFTFGAAGIISGVATFVWLPETNHRPIPRFDLGEIARGYFDLARRRAFYAPAIGGSCSIITIYGYFSVSAFILDSSFNLPATAVGGANMLVILSAASGAALISRARRIDGALIGNIICALAALAMIVLWLAHSLPFEAFIAALCVFGFGSGLVAPTVAASAIGASPGGGGAASSLYGCVQMMIGALAASIAAASPHTPLALGLLLLGGVAIGRFFLALPAR